MNQTVVFIHIPETAGSVVSSLLAARYESGERWHTGAQGMTHVASSLAFTHLSDEARAAYGLVDGQLEMSAVKAVPGDPFVFTLLRDPATRVAALYRQVRRNPSHLLHDAVMEQDLDLEEFVRTQPWDEIRNGMTRRLAGLVGRRMPAWSPAILQRALENLEKYVPLAGIRERLDQSLFLLGRRLGLAPEELVHQGPELTAVDPPSERPNRAALKAVYEQNRMDEVLYGYVRDCFLDQARDLEQDPEFARYQALLEARTGHPAQDVRAA